MTFEYIYNQRSSLIILIVQALFWSIPAVLSGHTSVTFASFLSLNIIIDDFSKILSWIKIWTSRSPCHNLDFF